MTIEESRLALILLRQSIQEQIQQDLHRIDDCFRFLDSVNAETHLKPDFLETCRRGVALISGGRA
ncbi:hypothetical protein [Methylobacterium sp. E-016]|uniref:hypothetical protein n=1 Tax=Methylobacterium sp. E-016 TaxID=2836556 RepID=UPI001FB91A3E|nr:hypothetical protein [Methylobacterium sp. E-016]